ncbi:dihydrodipicolinate synthase family protein [Aeromicrobium fastidiosum]|uniref:Dihydrodipicolinate synthase family protein n=1 Tax=Aeromicrobium fastidiosum TaxID=52699 RepID=A0A641ARG7_9ACTN|nr:dihydrodipicolinate synthase family protein [Aeromicrobium fastidiosum]KAA1380706.1 dihydrodipicolinate synthase family protein [Aeromicrobium fastidiosum]MBP2390320.1 4-hydroxy-tetrahydrodipicolinate synthase [Aeromicrobium fastidiosum]
MDRHDISWTGYIPAITTPFDAAGALDLGALDAQLAWLVEQGMHGVILAGTTGEWFSMSEDERAALFQRGAETVAGEALVLGGCNAFTADEVIRHARAAEAAGLDGILVTPPPYVIPNRREILAFYSDVSAGTSLPICVYNWPRGCTVDLDVDLLEEIAGLDQVVAIKNSTGDMRSFLSGLYRLGDRVRYFGVPTSELGADLVTLGHGDGLMGSGGVLGADHPDFWRALAAGDRERALRLGQRDRVIMERWFNPDYGSTFGSAQAIMKTALRLQGVPAGYVRRPLLELTSDEVGLVESTLHDLGIETVALT